MTKDEDKEFRQIASLHVDRTGHKHRLSDGMSNTPVHEFVSHLVHDVMRQGGTIELVVTDNYLDITHSRLNRVETADTAEG